MNGVSLRRACTLREGDVVEVAEHRFTLRSEALADEVPGLLWFVERTAGVLMRVGAAVVSVGGGPEDDLVVEGWPPRGMALHPVGAGLVLEALAPWHRRREAAGRGRPHAAAQRRSGGATRRVLPCRGAARGPLQAHWGPGARGARVGGRPHGPAARRSARRHDGHAGPLGAGGEALRARRAADAAAAAAAGRRDDPRCDGRQRLWPGADSGRIEINTLVCRVRKDLERVGVDGVTLIERRGGALRLNLAPGASVTVTKH